MNDWKSNLSGGYKGDLCPDHLKEEVKTWDRDELEGRYLDAIARIYSTSYELAEEVPE